MKTFQILFLASLFTLLSSSSFAQSEKTEKFKVSGNCGMCKKTIEKAAKDGGASYASWNKDLKELTVKYKSKSTELSKIQQKIADAGYDNAGAKASEKSYESLPDCCQYDREAKDAAVKK